LFGTYVPNKLNWVVETITEILTGARLKDYLEERRKNVERD